MTEKTIKELIEEALTFGVNVHDHVTKEMFRVVNMKTRHQAKQMIFAHLYGGSPNVAEKLDSKCPWKLTEEQIKARTPKEFKQEWMGEPFEQPDHPVMKISRNSLRPIKRAAQQSEDRMYRAGVIPFKVEVLDDAGNDGTIYTIHATSALDARCMAFVLDGGCQLGLKHWSDGLIELALTHTKVIG